jgi:hypothetical protein
MPVRGCLGDRLDGDVAAAWAIFDDEWLAKALRQPLRHQASEMSGNCLGLCR